MKIILAAFLAFALCSCSTAPNAADIEEDVEAKLQAQIDVEIGKGIARVNSIELVETTSPRFEGAATIIAGGRTVLLPIAVISDGDTAIVTADYGRIRIALEAAQAASIAALAGKYSDYILTPSIFARMPERLQRDKELLAGRLETVVPVDDVGNGYIGTGCKTGSCGMDEATWFLSKDGTQAAAIIMETSAPTEAGVASGFQPHLIFHVYSTEGRRLPPPLLEWSAERGMSSTNIAGEGARYVPPGTE